MLQKIHRIFFHFLMHLFGVNFSFYDIFYRKCIYAIPIIEPIIHLMPVFLRIKTIPGSRNEIMKINRGDIVLDLGANVGSISSLFLSRGANIHAYEPDSRCISLLKRRFKYYGKKITLHHAAVSNYNGETRLNYGSFNTEGNSIVENKKSADGSSGSETVPVKNITDIIDTLGHIRLIKMDIEGAEYDVLDALLTPAYSTKFDTILVEVHSEKIPSLKPRQKKLEKVISDLDLESRVILSWH
ncbi:FkbM family methyltransferase [Thalassospira sp. NFXS8]|uniref:FkbM family methyltransferase n=1 Tax=Thalassospira sp. NFXS8 TaxID=2819093 RepID=UPI0032DFF815